MGQAASLLIPFAAFALVFLIKQVPAKKYGSSGLSVVIGGSQDRNVLTIGMDASKTADRRDIPVPLLKFQILLPHLTLKSQKKYGSSGLSVVIGGSQDRNVLTIGMDASKTADRRDIPVPLLKFQILLPHLTLKSQKYLRLGTIVVVSTILGLLFFFSPPVNKEYIRTQDYLVGNSISAKRAGELAQKGDFQEALDIVTQGLRTQPDEVVKITPSSHGTEHIGISHLILRSFARMHLLCAYLNKELRHAEAADYHFERSSILRLFADLDERAPK